MFPVIDWSLISLEVLMAIILVGLVVADIVLPKNTDRDWIGTFSFIALFGLILFWLTQGHLNGTTFNSMFVMDPLAWFFKGFFLIVMVFIFAMTQEFFKTLGERRNEFYLLLWLALLGMCFMASSSDFLVLFISIEILTISLYVMTAYLKSDKLSIEAGMKYLILGSLSAGFMLYGISFLYGTTRSTHFDIIANFAAGHPMSAMALFALVLIFTAVAFKTAAVPFHLWVADVYQGAPTPVTALLSVGSKAAGFVVLIRLFFLVFKAWHPQWSLVFAVLSAITMTYGNLVALFQTNIKRLLGYSSVAHAGYLLMGAAAGTALGAAGINFYLLGYLFTNLAAFMVIVIFSIAAKSDTIADYAGLARRSGLLAWGLLLALVSLAGIPPLAGFFGKFILLMAVIKSGYVWLALIAAANIVISFYYYLLIAKRVYVDAPLNDTPIAVPAGMQLLLVLAMAGIIIIGIFQGPFFAAASHAAAIIP
ncbi:MAG: NADH-quinone oxidoreductase subunit N [Candidatus Omnitrophica bacterium]|nr:NADH-quinone oxidoreductase subunit N [Candidatus Omnitrophota bacterium]MDE2221748.1 NADH-quinone oxidoreductase subunit N [Candidatus Omnitrophota bacterium]